MGCSWVIALRMLTGSTSQDFPCCSKYRPNGLQNDPSLPIQRYRKTNCTPLPPKAKQPSLSLSGFWTETTEERYRVQWKSTAEEITSDSSLHEANAAPSVVTVTET